MSEHRPVIGIGGLSGAGKSAVARRLCQILGFCHIDLDKVGHSVLENHVPAIVASFGNGILDPEGKIDRRALGSLVFSDVAQLAKLEAIVHPAMRESVYSRISEKKFPGYIIEGALIIKMELGPFCDKVFWIHSPFLTRLKRIMDRDTLDRPRALQRLVAQGPLATQAKNSSADIIRVNHTSVFRSCRSILDILGCEYGTKKSSARSRFVGGICISPRGPRHLAVLSKSSAYQETD